MALRDKKLLTGSRKVDAMLYLNNRSNVTNTFKNSEVNNFIVKWKTKRIRELEIIANQ